MQLLPVISPEIKTQMFLPSHNTFINEGNLKKHFIGKCIELMDKCSVAYEKEYYFLSHIEHLYLNDMHFFIFYSGFDGMTSGMKRYHIGVYSMLLIELYYYDSNATDLKHNFTFEDLVKNFSSYCTGMKQIADNTLKQFSNL